MHTRRILRSASCAAEELGLSDAAKLLEATLREEKATDEALTQIAETVVNQEAQTQDAA